MFVMICLAMAIGISCGGGIIGLIWCHRGNQAVDSFMPSDQLIGLYGVVDIPFGHGHPGKVRINIGDSVLNLRAFAYDSEDFERGNSVLVVAVEDNYVLVISEDSLYILAQQECMGLGIDPLLRDYI
ncbi:hypothetical protein [Acaryochloris sp. IP29b_bin.148]|uniref:hypothetical protein n=1 Tax=Acaryochloris sp. IP29b_bin.148 TaxID=2969218 RepID=UPI002601B719|nr:hypothetical protein [Acaryochloris sp. IP29b_bin.148]